MVDVWSSSHQPLPDFVSRILADVGPRKVVVEVDGVGCFELAYSHVWNWNGDLCSVWLLVIYQTPFLFTQKYEIRGNFSIRKSACKQLHMVTAKYSS